MTTRFNQPSLRPAPAIPDLPPGLQPHAVLALAPPTDRRRSAAMSAAVYAVLAGGVIWLAHTGAAAILHPPMTHGTFDINEQPPIATPAPMHPAAAPKTPAVPVLAKVTPPSDAIPDTTAPLSTVDHSMDPPATPTTSTPTTPMVTGNGGGPVSLSSDAVRVLHQVNPQYPPLAIASRLQGQVVVRMVIDEQGVPIQAEAVSGPEVFKGPAMRAAQQWRFAPAMSEGRAVPATFLLTLNFVLR